MEQLRTIAKLKLCIPPLYHITGSCLKLCYLNARSVHKHIQDLHKDLHYSSSDINIFAETRFSLQDPNGMYDISGYNSSEMIILTPVLDLLGPMVVQLCAVKSHTYLDIPTVKIYMVLKLR